MNAEQKSKYVFFLGGYDAEMVAIRRMLEVHGERFHDRNLSWGASLSDYSEEVRRLPIGALPVFIELKLDVPYPENSIVVDHHGDRAGKDKKTAIEQIAGMLGVELDRKQQLISANDKGYIRGMKRLFATDEEILEIREMDRKAQGISTEDERRAEESVSRRSERVGESAVIIDSLTNRAAPLTDRLYDRFKHIFIFFPDGKMGYSGEGEMVCCLAESYKEKKKKNPDVDFWFGGDLPDYGYFGTVSPMERNELKKLIKEMDERVISQHIFMFPFRIKDKRKINSGNEYPATKTEDIINAFKGTGWKSSSFTSEFTTSKYSEYFYFHEYARDAIFGSRDNKENSISYHFERFDSGELKEGSMMLYIRGRDEPYKLQLDHVSLRVFETGIGILTIQAMNFRYPSIDDVLLINDFGRRIYPQFLPDPDSNGKVDMDIVKDKFLADTIAFRCGNIDSTEEFCHKDYNDYTLRPADYISKLLGVSFTESFETIPIIDDRMFVVCWYGSDCWSNELKKMISLDPGYGCVNNAERRIDMNSGKPSYYNCDEWYRFLYMDGKDIGCQNEELKEQLIRKATYDRWLGSGTLFGITRYSFVCITDTEYFGSTILRNHMQSMYYQMALILLTQRASILKFSAEVARLSGKIRDFLEEEDKGNKKAEGFETIAKEIKKLHASYIRFVNRLWFTEVTPQEQGIEMYDMALDSMGLKEQIEELKAEIKELYEFADMQYEKYKALEDRKINTRLANLNIIAFIFIPITVVAGLWGMNIFSTDELPRIVKVINEFLKINLSTQRIFYQRVWILVITLLPFIILSVVIYFLPGLIKLIKKMRRNT